MESGLEICSFFFLAFFCTDIIAGIERRGEERGLVRRDFIIPCI